MKPMNNRLIIGFIYNKKIKRMLKMLLKVNADKQGKNAYKNHHEYFHDLLYKY